MSQENNIETLVATRRKVLKSFKSNTRVFDDYSIEVTPKAEGEPSQLEVKKVGKNKRYVTNGKSPLACIELKVPADVPDRAFAFFYELDKLTKDIQLHRPPMPEGEVLEKKDDIHICLDDETQEVNVWMRIHPKKYDEQRKDLYNLFSTIERCLAARQTTRSQRR